MSPSTHGAALAALLLLAAPALPAPPSPEDAPRPRLAIALSGGGARGIAHVGVLRAFEEQGIPIDAIAGTSIGSVLGSIYATGRNAAQLEEAVKSLDWESIFNDRADRRLVPVARREDRHRAVAGLGFDFWELRLPAGVLGEYRVNRFLIEVLSPASYAVDGDFDRLKIPFHAVATALDTGERIVLKRGNLPRAVRASMSFPLAFPPVYWDGRPLVDGGVVDNLPVREARAFGAAVVVAVDVRSPPPEASAYRTAIGVASQVSNLLTERVNAEVRAEADVLVRPEVGRHGFNDYRGFDALIAAGYEAGLRAIPEIRRRLEAATVSLPPPAQPAPERQLAGTRIAEIRVEGSERYSERLIRRTFNIPLGLPFDLQKGLLALDKVNALGFFDFLWLDVEPVEDGLRIVLRVKDGAANRVEIGAGYDDSNRAHGVIKLKNRNTLGFGEQTDVVAVAGDAEVGVEGRILGDRVVTTLVGFEAAARYLSERPRFYADDGTYVNRGRFVRRDLRFALRRAIKRSWLFEADLQVGNVKTEPRLGLDIPVGTDQVRKVGLGAVYDVLDDRYYPSARLRFDLRAERNLAGLGGTRSYWRTEGSLRAAVRVGGRGVAQVDGFGGLSGGDVPAYDQFRIGGPILLPGYRIDERWGAQAIAAAVSFRRRLFGQFRAVARAGAGNVWASRDDIGFPGLRYGFGVGLVHPTRIGPVAADLGIRRGGGALFTFSIGYP